MERRLTEHKEKNKSVERQNLSNRVKFKDDGETYPTLQERNKVRK